MPRKRYSSEQIIIQLREAEVELAKGHTAACCGASSTSRTLWVSESGVKGF